MEEKSVCGHHARANEQIRELLQQDSFMERKLAAQREDIERLATRVETAERALAEIEAKPYRAEEIIARWRARLEES